MLGLFKFILMQFIIWCALSVNPTGQPSGQPSTQPTGQPSSQPTGQPSGQPTSEPSGQPTSQPTSQPTGQPSGQPTGEPSGQPSGQPTGQPSGQPSGEPTSPTGQPSGAPSAAPSFVKEDYAFTSSPRRSRGAGLCANQCNGHGLCNRLSDTCRCYQGLDEEEEWTGPDCSLRVCPKNYAWTYHDVVGQNDPRPWVECSNRGYCNREIGECECYDGFDGMACQRKKCPEDCNSRGFCLPVKLLAEKAGTVYTTPWDSNKIWGCLCDKGYRGPSCRQQECPSFADPRGALGNLEFRDCSGRGTCDYNSGICECHPGYYGEGCHKIMAML